MTRERSFLEMIEQVRAGDEDAARLLLSKYEAQVRRIARVRLTDPMLRRQLDSLDICQSVMAEFFMRVSVRQYELETPQQLLNLLAMMTRNRVLNHARKQHAARRDTRRLADGDGNDFSSPDPSPSQIVEDRDLVDRVRSRLTAEEKMLIEQRSMGEPWSVIADRMGSSPAALRMRLSRAIERVSRDLDSQENSDG